MSTTRSNPRAPVNWRDNEFWGELTAWEQKHGRDNSDQIDRLRRNMRKVRSTELTARQEEMLHLYYDLGLSIPRIAARLGVHKSSVSRTLARGRTNLKRYLQYSL